MNKRKKRYRKLKRLVRIAAVAAVENMLEAIDDNDITVIQKRPYTCVTLVVFLPVFGIKTYVGFSKQRPIDKWAEEHGINLATRRAKLDITDALVSANMGAMRTSGVLTEYLNGDLPIDQVPHDNPEYYTPDTWSKVVDAFADLA